MRSSGCRLARILEQAFMVTLDTLYAEKCSGHPRAPSSLALKSFRNVSSLASVSFSTSFSSCFSSSLLISYTDREKKFQV